jgi:acyl-CoA synthetase (NDP forming)
LPAQFVKRVHSLFRSDVIAITNPIDLGVIFDFDLYAQIVEECLKTLSPDAILLINTFSLDEAEAAHRLARRVEEIVKRSGRPVAFCVYSQGDEGYRTQRQTNLPVFAGIEDALRGLAASRDWNSRSTRALSPQVVQVPSHETQRLLMESGVLTADLALSLCKAYDIPVAPFEVANDPKQASKVADRLGYPVAVKALATNLLHKSDAGGVVLELTDAAAVERESVAMLARVLYPARLFVQRMIGGGLEVIIGGKQDRSFGPVVMFGLGGIYVEVLGDVSFRVAPLSRTDAELMIKEVHGKRLLEGIRGRAPMDREALIKALLSVSRILTENPSISEVDINPLLVLDHGVSAIDARVLISKNEA